jgi:hypothetical protein
VLIGWETAFVLSRRKIGIYDSSLHQRISVPRYLQSTNNIDLPGNTASFLP